MSNVKYIFSCLSFLSKHYMIVEILKQLSPSLEIFLDMMEKWAQFMRNSMYASTTTVPTKNNAKLTRAEILDDYSYLHRGVFVQRCLQHRFFECPTPAAAFTQQIHAHSFPSFARRFLFPLPDEVALSEDAVWMAVETPVHVRRQQSSKDMHLLRRSPPRVKTQQPGRNELQVCKRQSATGTLRWLVNSHTFGDEKATRSSYKCGINECKVILQSPP